MPVGSQFLRKNMERNIGFKYPFLLLCEEDFYNRLFVL